MGKLIHAGTFNGYPLGLAAVKITLDILMNKNIGAYNNMIKHDEKLYNVFLAEPNAIGLDSSGLGSYNCHNRSIEDYSQLKEEIIIKNTVIRERLMSYGILISQLSRIYPNISLNDEDIAFCRNRIGYALKDAKLIIGRLF